VGDPINFGDPDSGQTKNGKLIYFTVSVKTEGVLFC